MKTKKIISVLLAVLMLTTIVPCFALAEGEETIAGVREYLVAPSQYTNTGIGSNIEKTLTGSGLSSLGNFGGYVIYEFNEPILNSDNHACGVDFMVCGNAFNAALTTQEPGQVWVSQDGKNWFALAGSEHYEDETVWDYSVTYKKLEDRKCAFTDSLGESGVVSPGAYPLANLYTTVTVPDDNLTLSGVLLRKQRTPSTANGIQTSFGYADALSKSSSSSPVNPYCENPAVNGRDGQFDISWAVDKNGVGVELDWIKYVKVQTATFIDGGAFGEKSTEITSVMLADAAETSVGKTPAPVSITVGGTELELEDGKDYYEAAVSGEFDVEVETDANVYINNAYGSSRHFGEQTQKGIVRVIVQSEMCSPVIYYINTGNGISKEEITISENEKTLEAGNTTELTAKTDSGEKIVWTSSDESVVSVDENGKVTANAPGEAFVFATAESGRSAKCRITVIEPAPSAAVTVTFSASGGETAVQRHEISAVSGAAREYGYDAAYFDHNGVRVQGVTVLDVLVAAHEELYGDGFTAESKDEYLVVNSGFITKTFGQSAASSGFIVNGVVPNDGIYNPDYYGFTGYSCDTAVLNDGDAVSYFFYRDTKYYADYYSWFDSETYTANEGEALTVNLNGYSAMYYGFNSWQTILDRYAKPLEGVEIYTYIDGEKTLLGVTDKNGNAKISFSEQGRYIIFAEGSAPDEDGELVPVIVPYAEVTVNVKQNEKPDRMTFCEWIKHVWKVIYKWFAEVFNFLFGWISDVC